MQNIHLDETALNEYADGMLSAGAQAAADAHLAGCESCRTRLAELQWLFAELNSVPDERPSRDLAAATVAILSARTAQGRSFSWRMVALQLVVTAIAATLVWPLLGQAISHWAPPIQQRVGTLQIDASWPVVRASAELWMRTLAAHGQQWSQRWGENWLPGLARPPLPELSIGLWLALLLGICLLWAAATRWLVLNPARQPPKYKTNGEST